MKKFLVIFGISLAMAGIATVLRANAQTGGLSATASVTDIKVTVQELAAAGFTNPVAVPSAMDRYASPVFYFQVGESAGGEAQNIVAVLVRPMADKSWVYNNGQIEVSDMGGKSQARIGGGGYYIVVTGPDAGKVSRLAQSLKALY